MCDVTWQRQPNLVLAFHISDKSPGACVCTDREIEIKTTHYVFSCKWELHWGTGEARDTWKDTQTVQRTNFEAAQQRCCDRTGRRGAPMTQVNYPWDRGGNTCPRSSLTGLGNKCPQHSTKESNWAAAGLWQAESCSCKVSVSVRLHQKKGGLKETKQSVSASVSGHVSSCDRCFGTQAVVLYHT